MMPSISDKAFEGEWCPPSWPSPKPRRTRDLGEGECGIFMEPLIPSQVQLAPPPIGMHNWGRLGGGRIHAEAKELRNEESAVLSLH